MSYLPFSEVANLQTTKYANIGGLAILIFDYGITFQDEVQWTWSRPWDLPRIIFIISRYLPFAGVGMTAYSALRVSGPCPHSSLEENIIHILCIVASEGLLLLRTWAFWKKSKRVLIGLLLYGLLTMIAATVVDISQLIPGGQTLSLGVSTEPMLTGPAAECPFEASRNAALVYSFLAMYECVILVLTVYKRFHDYAELRSSLINIVYGDGMLYILCIIAITVANVVVGVAFPIGYSDIFDSLQIVIHSVLASRILFRLRSSHDKAYETHTGLSLDSIHYWRPSNLTSSAV